MKGRTAPWLTQLSLVCLVLSMLVGRATSDGVDPFWIDEGWELPGTDIAAICSSDTVHCPKATESFLLAQHPPGVRRSRANLPKWEPPYSPRWADTLRIEGDTGDATLVNYECDCDGATRYFYLGLISRISYHVVYVAGYEQRSFLLVHARTARKFQIDSFPVASLDGRYFITASCDLTAGYQPNEVQIWAVRDSSITLDWRLYLRPGDEQIQQGEIAWGPIKPRWVTPTEARVKLRVLRRRGDRYDEIDTDREVRLFLSEKGWRLADLVGR